MPHLNLSYALNGRYMTRLVWTTDIHLDFAELVTPFYDRLIDAKPDALLITGDIAEGPKLEEYLRQMADLIQRPVYFVLGNHDYYDRSIREVRQSIRQITRGHDLVWLTESDPIELKPDTALVGHDGWSDGGYGDFIASSIEISDYRRITDLIGLSAKDRLIQLNRLGDESAAYFNKVLPPVLAHYRQVFVAMHPPPYQEACWYMDRPAEDDNIYLPHFTCKAVGVVLRQLAVAHPRCTIKVLAGHTHHRAEAQIADNLHVLVAGAEYGQPAISSIFDI